MECKLKKKLTKDNLAVISIYTWFKIKLFETENKAKKNYLLESMAFSAGYIDELIEETKKPIKPIILPDNTKLLLEEDKYNSEENSFFNDNNLNNNNLSINEENKRDINLLFIALEHFKGMIEYKNYNKILPDEIENIARYIKYKFIPKDSYVFKEGDEPDNLYFIIKGKVQILDREYIDRTKELKGVYIGERQIDLLNDDEDNCDENDKLSINNNKNNNLENKNNKIKLSNNSLFDLDDDNILEPYWKTRKSMLLSSVKNKQNLQTLIDKYDPEENEFVLSKTIKSNESKDIELNLEIEINDSSLNQVDKDDLSDSKNNLVLIQKNSKEKNINNINIKSLFQNKQKKIKFKLQEENKIKKINSPKKGRRLSVSNTNIYIKNYENNKFFGNIIDNINNNQLKSKRSNLTKKNKRRFSSEMLIFKKVEKNIKELFKTSIDKEKKELKKKNENDNININRNEKAIFNFNNKTKEEKNENPKFVVMRKSKKSKTIMSRDKKEIIQKSLNLSNKKNNILKNENFRNPISNIKIEFSSDNSKNNMANYYIDKNTKNDNDLLLKHNLLNYGRILKDQDFFGEESLKYNTLQEYSALCLTDVHLFTLNKEYYEKLLLEKVTKSEKRMSKFIQKIFPLLKQKPKYISLIEQLRPNFVIKNKYIYTTFDKADYLYLIYQGECALVEPLENLDNKVDFLIEKSKYKTISILKEGAIAGYESCLYNNILNKRIIKNYDNCLLVTGNHAIVFKIPVDDFISKDNLFLNSISNIKKQREKFSIMKLGLISKSFQKKITFGYQTSKLNNISSNLNFNKFPEIIIPKENNNKSNINPTNIKKNKNKKKESNNYKIKNIDNITSIVYHNREDNEINEKINNKENNTNISSLSNNKRKVLYNNNSYSRQNIKLNKKTNLKNNFHELNSEKNNKVYYSYYMNKLSDFNNIFVKNNKESSYYVHNSNKKKLKLFKIKKNLLNRKAIDEKEDLSLFEEELKNNINTYNQKIISESTKKKYSPFKQNFCFSNNFKNLIEEKKNLQNNKPVLNQNDLSKKDISKKASCPKFIFNNSKSNKHFNNLIENQSMIRKYYYSKKNKKKQKKFSMMDDRNILYNSGDFTLPFVYKLISQRENKKK